ncbi:HNH endonuclease [Acinetobacter sp. YH16056_T]
MEVDHIKPLWMGGSNNLNNLQLLCKSPCHELKTAEEATLRGVGGLD